MTTTAIFTVKRFIGDNGQSHYSDSIIILTGRDDLSKGEMQRLRKEYDQIDFSKNPTGPQAIGIYAFNVDGYAGTNYGAYNDIMGYMADSAQMVFSTIYKR